MTQTKSRGRELLSFTLLIITVALGVVFSKEMGTYVTEGINIAVMSVIPSSFPFMIISDFYTRYGQPENMKIPSKIFARVSGLPESCLGAFICGNIGGFPIGAKMSADLYKSESIDKDVAERLSALSSNPSCAFIIGAVGLGMYSSIEIGIILLMSVYASCGMCAIIFRRKSSNIHLNNKKPRQNYDFVSSVKSSGANSVSLIAFISCFSVLVGMVKNHVKNSYISSLIIMLSEVTCAAKNFSDRSLFSPLLSLILTAFSLGFGGFSVMMQASIFTKEAGLSTYKYVYIKLLQGVISSAVSCIVYFLILK